MAYQIHYVPGKRRKWRSRLLTFSFFLLFLLVANFLFPEQLNALRQMFFPQQTWDAMAAFYQDIIDIYAG